VIVKLNVLIADDEENDRDLLRLAFKKAGLDRSIFAVSNGQQAVDYLGGSPPYSDRDRYPLPSLMLLDLNMPAMDGFEVLAWMQERPDLAHVPVVVLSGSPREEDMTRAKKLGARDYKVKPADLSGLVEIVKDLDVAWLSPTSRAEDIPPEPVVEAAHAPGSP
jgi:CheY-like chemotaxis protein